MRTISITVSDDTVRCVRSAFYHAFGKWPTNTEIDQFVAATASQLVEDTVLQAAAVDIGVEV